MRFTKGVVVVALVAMPGTRTTAESRCSFKRVAEANGNRICYYSCLRGEAAITVRSFRRCPSFIDDPTRDPNADRSPRWEFTSPLAEAAKAMEESQREQLEKEKLRLEVEKLRRELATDTPAKVPVTQEPKREELKRETQGERETETKKETQEPRETETEKRWRELEKVRPEFERAEQESLWIAATTQARERIHIIGEPIALKNELLALVRGSVDILPDTIRSDVYMNVQKTGTANVQCGAAMAVLPGPTASDLVQQLRAWLRERVAR